MSERKCNSCIHSHVCEKHIHDVWNEFDDCRDYDAERPHGEWERLNEWFGYSCSICKYHCGTSNYNFCPDCGASMVQKEGEGNGI